MKFAAIAVLVLIGLAGFWLWTPDKSRAALEAKYVNAPGDMLDVAGVHLHVRDSGPREAPAIIMLHGFGSSLHTWEAWARALQQDYRVIRLDLPGSGLSGPDPTGDYTDARTTEILLALMDRLGLAESSLAGNSIGGRIAWRFAALHPERVTKLVLVAPDGFESEGIVYGRAPVVSGTARLMRYVLPKFLIRMNLQAAYGDPAALSGATVDRYYDLMRAPGVRDAIIARMEQTVLEDPRPLLRLAAMGMERATLLISRLASVPHEFARQLLPSWFYLASDPVSALRPTVWALIASPGSPFAIRAPASLSAHAIAHSGLQGRDQPGTSAELIGTQTGPTIVVDVLRRALNS